MSVKADRSESSITTVRKVVADRARRYGSAKKGRSGQVRVPQGPTRSPPGATEKGARTSRVVVRRLAPTTVLKVSVLFYLSLSIALITAAVLLWAGARSVGVIGNVESFMDQVGFTDFRIQAGPLLRASVIASAVLVVAGSLANLLMAVLYNLISDLVGGIKLVVAEDPEAPEG